MSNDTRIAIRIGIRLSSNTAPTRCSVSRSSPGRAGVGAGRPMRRRRLSRRVLRGCKCVRGGAATRHQSKPVVSLASPGHAGADRGARGQRHATWLCAGRDHRLRSNWRVRSRRRSRSRSARFASCGGTLDRRALWEVLPAVGTVGRCRASTWLSIWIATQPVDFRRGMDPLAMPGKRGVWG